MKREKTIIGEIILYQNSTMPGEHRHVFNMEADLKNPEDPTFNDAVSSFVILKGVWKLYRDTNYRNAYDGEFSPGTYERTNSYEVRNDEMSSLKCIRP